LINGEKHTNGGSAVARRPPRRRGFTDALVRTMRPEARSFRLWDTRVPGLVLRVWPSGKKSFYAAYYCRGQRRWYFIGRYPVVGVADARKMAGEVLVKVAMGQDPAADRNAHRGATLGEVHRRYIDEHASKHNKSWQQGKFLVEKYVLPRLGKIPVKDVTRADVRTTIGGLKSILANQVLAALSAIFTWGAKQDLVTVNPCKGIDRNPTRSRSRIVSDSEVPMFWSTFSGSSVAHRVLKVIWLTGQRPGEVSSMRWEHIRDGWWEMPGQKTQVWVGTKNKQDHRVWLPRAARAIIDGQRQANVTPIKGHVFADAGDRPVENLDAVMRAVC